MSAADAWDDAAERAWEAEGDAAYWYERDAAARLTPSRWRDHDRHTATVDGAAAWERDRTMPHEDDDPPSRDEA